MPEIILVPNVQAAHAVLQLQDTGKPVYKVKNVSLNALCELYNAPINPMKEQVEEKYLKFLSKNICFTAQKYLGEKHLPAGPEVLGAAAADPGHDLLRRRGRARPRAHHLQRHGQVQNSIV